MNWLLLLLNLIPVHPFDGGRMLQACLSALWQGAVATGVYIKVGCLIGFLGLLGGMLADSTFVVAISAFVLLMNLQESYQLRSGESYDDSFLGYDFSQGYTSLERDDEDRPQKRPGMLKRWRERRRDEKQRQLQERDAEVQQQLDAILDKIQADGMESLTDAERRQLDRASALYREKGNTSD